MPALQSKDVHGAEGFALVVLAALIVKKYSAWDKEYIIFSQREKEIGED
jgi:hypothetical protein